MSPIVDTDDPVQRVLLVLLVVALTFLAITYVRPGMFVPPAAPTARPAASAATAPTVTVGGAVDLGIGAAPPTANAKSAANTAGDLGSAAAVALTVVNTGSEPDRLLGASSDIGGEVAVVERAGHGNEAATHPLPGGAPVPAGASVALDPDATHLLLTGITAAEHKGDTFRLTLRFERAGEVVVPVQVRRSADKAEAKAAAPVTAGALRIENAWARAADSSELQPVAAGADR